MLGTDAFAGVPSGLFTLGSAGAALIVGRLSQRYGRRTGLTAGFMIGGLGAIGVITAAIINSVSFYLLPCSSMVQEQRQIYKLVTLVRTWLTINSEPLPSVLPWCLQHLVQLLVRI